MIQRVFRNVSHRITMEIFSELDISALADFVEGDFDQYCIDGGGESPSIVGDDERRVRKRPVEDLERASPRTSPAVVCKDPLMLSAIAHAFKHSLEKSARRDELNLVPRAIASIGNHLKKYASNAQCRLFVLVGDYNDFGHDLAEIRGSVLLKFPGQRAPVYLGECCVDILVRKHAAPVPLVRAARGCVCQEEDRLDDVVPPAAKSPRVQHGDLSMIMDGPLQSHEFMEETGVEVNGYEEDEVGDLAYRVAHASFDVENTVTHAHQEYVATGKLPPKGPGSDLIVSKMLARTLENQRKRQGHNDAGRSAPNSIMHLECGNAGTVHDAVVRGTKLSYREYRDVQGSVFFQSALGERKACWLTRGLVQVFDARYKHVFNTFTQQQLRAQSSVSLT